MCRKIKKFKWKWLFRYLAHEKLLLDLTVIKGGCRVQNGNRHMLVCFSCSYCFIFHFYQFSYYYYYIVIIIAGD